MTHFSLFHKRVHVWMLILLWLVVHVLIYSYVGPRLDLVDAHAYLETADQLFKTGHLRGDYQLFYSAYISIIAFFRVVFPCCIFPIILFQSFLSLLATLSLYKASERLFKSSYAGLATGILFLIWWDCINWNLTLMTESLFCSLCCFLIYSLTVYSGKRTQILGIMLLLVALLAVRPTGIIFWISVFWFVLRVHRTYFETHALVAVAVVIVGVAALLFMTLEMFSIWDFTEQYAKGNIVTYADQFNDADVRQYITTPASHAGSLASDPRHPLLKIVSYMFKNPGEFSKAAVLKGWYLMSATRPYYSLVHNIYSAGWMIVIYVSFVKGILSVNRSSFMPTFSVIVIAINILLVLLATIDWDNRFYIPMEPGIVCFSGGGLVLLVKSLKSTIVSSGNGNR